VFENGLPPLTGYLVLIFMVQLWQQQVKPPSTSFKCKSLDRVRLHYHGNQNYSSSFSEQKNGQL